MDSLLQDLRYIFRLFEHAPVGRIPRPYIERL